MSEELFAAESTVKKRPLNVLPDNPDPQGRGRFPSWLHRKMPSGATLWKTGDAVDCLPTVCEEAKCPNRLECWSQKAATFLALGRECTRSCGFCDIDFSTKPLPPDPKEPQKIAESARKLGLRHVVVTQVARDDLPDGGASHMAKIIEEVKKEASVEVLTSDFQGDEQALECILDAKPEIFNHNVETVQRLAKRVRHKASYERTLALLHKAHAYAPHLLLKSGLMVGLGEEIEEVEETIRDLHEAGCSAITIGQYLQPSQRKLRVKEFIPPAIFDHFVAFGKRLGVKYLYAGPFVRSSYNAKALFEALHG